MDEITEGRFQLLEDMLEHYAERLEYLEAEDKHAEGMRLNWIVVALFVLELVVGVGELWWMVRHG